MPNVWRQFRCTFTHLPIVKPCYDNQRVSLHAYVNKLLLCRCKVICAAIHSLQLSAACECPCMKKSCNTLSAFLRCKSCKVNPFLAHCPTLGWTLSETMWLVNFKNDSVFEHSFHIYLHMIIFLFVLIHRQVLSLNWHRDSCLRVRCIVSPPQRRHSLGLQKDSTWLRVWKFCGIASVWKLYHIATCVKKWIPCFP